METKTVNIPVESTTEVVCVCGCNKFTPAFRLRFYGGGLYSPNPVFLPMSIFACNKCGIELSIKEHQAQMKLKKSVS